MIPMPASYSQTLGLYAANYSRVSNNQIPIVVGRSRWMIDPPGAASHIAVATSGTGYAVGQVVQLQGGAVILITSVSTGAVTGGTIIFGGSGYTVGQLVNQIGGGPGTGFQGTIVHVVPPYAYAQGLGSVAAS